MPETEKRRRPALVHHPEKTVADARAILDAHDGADWTACTIDGHPGVWVTPKYGTSVGEFAAVLGAFGGDWTMRPDPRL